MIRTAALEATLVELREVVQAVHSAPFSYDLRQGARLTLDPE